MPVRSCSTEPDRSQSQLKIVQHGQKLLDRAGNGEIAEVCPFARFPLAGILKFSLQTRQPVDQLVALALEAIDLALQMRLASALFAWGSRLSTSAAAAIRRVCSRIVVLAFR